MFQALDEAVAFIRHKSVAMVDLKFCDLWGRWRHVTLPAGRFNQRLLETGVGFDGSSLGLSAVKSGDLVLVPELATAFLDPFWDVPTISFFFSTSSHVFTPEPCQAMQLLSSLTTLPIQFTALTSILAFSTPKSGMVMTARLGAPMTVPSFGAAA